VSFLTCYRVLKLLSLETAELESAWSILPYY